MQQSLILLRILGAFLGCILTVWAFSRFRLHVMRRREFVLTSFFGLSLIVVAAAPSSIDILTGMMLLENQQFGRLITLLIVSNLVLWIAFFSLRNSDSRRAVQFDLLVRKLAQEKFFSAGMQLSIQPIMVIIPALDEAENLDRLLPKMPRSVGGLPVGILVVDDGSSDDTVETVKRHSHLVVSNPLNRGGGAALRLGYDIAMAGGARIVVTMDGDGQHLPEEIEGLVQPIMQDRADFVIGSRILGRREKDSIVRWIGIHVFNGMINLLAGTTITDCSNGFRAFRVRSLQKVLLLQDQFHTAELIIDAARKGIRIADAPVTVMRRHSGESKKGKNFSYGLNFTKTVIRTWLRK